MNLKNKKFVLISCISLKKYRAMKNRYGDRSSYEIEVQRIMELAENE